MITVAPADPRAPEAARLLDALSDTLARITGSTGRASFDASDMDGESALFVLARDDHGQAVGCGAYRPLEPRIAEIKRMYAVPGTRGVGAAMLAYLEGRAREDGYAEAWLETRLVNERAVRLWQAMGFEILARVPGAFDHPVHGYVDALVMHQALRTDA